MGLIMLILIGTVPTAYALNRTLPAAYVPSFVQNSLAASKVVEAKAAGYDVLGDPRPAVTNYLTAHHLDEGTYPSLAVLMRNIANDVQTYGTLAKIPAAQVRQYPQRHVSRIRGYPVLAKRQGSRAFNARYCDARRLQKESRQCDQGCGRDLCWN
jgi:hypothetical protein